jgi:hypothetical protein
MYSREVIFRKEQALVEVLGFQPVRHSVEDCRTWVEHLDSLIGDNKELIRPLDADEEKWCLNERALCQIDFLYWAERYALINNFENRLTLFKPNVAQLVMHRQWEILESEGKPIKVQNLKARQLGMSTLSELAIAHRVQFMPQVRAIVGSSDPDKSSLMAKMMELVWAHMPWWLLPERTKYKSGVLIEFGGLPTSVSVQHGTQFTGIGRGTTVTASHLSELSDFDNPEELVDAALMHAMHESPRIFCVLESTAKGIGNWWHKTWKVNNEMWGQGGGFCPVFLPWYVGFDLYPTATWLETRRDIFEKWQPSDLVLAHSDRAEEYVRSRSLLRDYFGADWKISREQQFWWDITRNIAKAKGQLAQFYSEVPADDTEAFQSSNISIFDGDVLADCRERAKPLFGVFGVEGPEGQIPERLRYSVRDVDVTRRPIEVVSAWASNMPPMSYRFVPLRYQGSGFDPLGKVLIWETPERHEEYGLGIDTGEGVGRDRTVIEVVRKGTTSRNDAQVAEFASPYINSFNLWPIANAIGTLYSTYKEGRRRQAKIVVECAGNGETVQLELKKRGWANFHHWVRYDSKRINQAAAVKIGWYTTGWSRAMMLDHLISYVRDGWVDLNSRWLIDEEMANFERNEEKQKLMAAIGAWDDRIMALGIVLFSLHDLETRGGNIAAQERAAQAEEALRPRAYPGHPGSREIGYDEDLANYTEFWERF